jgi:LysM repeat protein
MDQPAHCRSRISHWCITGALTLLLFLIPQTLRAQDGGLSESAQAIAAAVNQARADAGLGPLAVDPLLNQAAQNHVNDMVNNYVYGHYGSDGSSVQVRVARTGYAQSPWVSENWVSSTSVAGAMSWWMNDYIHRVNILNGNWQEIGVGVGTRGGEMIFVTVFSGNSGDGAVEAAVAAVAPEAAPPAADPPAAPPAAPAEVAPAPAQPLTIPAEGLDYTIQPGDTLLSVALAYGMTWETLAAANGLSDGSLLQIGQVIRLPGANSPAPATQAAANAAPPPPPVETEPYSVKEGDTLFSIAARKGVTWQEVAAVNGYGEQVLLQIGQEIKVPKKVVVAKEAPAAAAAPAAPPVAATDLHTVGDGETIISIALQHDLDWQQLLALNGLAEDTLLQPGQALRLR